VIRGLKRDECLVDPPRRKRALETVITRPDGIQTWDGQATRKSTRQHVSMYVEVFQGPEIRKLIRNAPRELIGVNSPPGDTGKCAEFFRNRTDQKVSEQTKNFNLCHVSQAWRNCTRQGVIAQIPVFHNGKITQLRRNGTRKKIVPKP